MTKDIPDMLEDLATRRGCVVSSADCEQMEIAVARTQGRFYVDDDDGGYVMRPREWLDQAVRAAEIRGCLADLFHAFHAVCHEGDGVPTEYDAVYDRAKALLGE